MLKPKKQKMVTYDDGKLVTEPPEKEQPTDEDGYPVDWVTDVKETGRRVKVPSRKLSPLNPRTKEGNHRKSLPKKDDGTRDPFQFGVTPDEKKFRALTVLQKSKNDTLITTTSTQTSIANANNAARAGIQSMKSDDYKDRTKSQVEIARNKDVFGLARENVKADSNQSIARTKANSLDSSTRTKTRSMVTTSRIKASQQQAQDILKLGNAAGIDMAGYFRANFINAQADKIDANNADIRASQLQQQNAIDPTKPVGSDRISFSNNSRFKNVTKEDALMLLRSGGDLSEASLTKGKPKSDSEGGGKSMTQASTKADILSLTTKKPKRKP